MGDAVLLRCITQCHAYISSTVTWFKLISISIEVFPIILIGSRRNHLETFLNLNSSSRVRCHLTISGFYNELNLSCQITFTMAAEKRLQESIIMCTELLLACTWHSDKVRNGFQLSALLCTVKSNWAIVTGPQSSLRQRANSNNQSIIMKPAANWVTHGVLEDETDTETQIYICEHLSGREWMSNHGKLETSLVNNL